MFLSNSLMNKKLNSRPTLRVWENDFGIPSMDIQSLQLLTYVKMNKLNIDIEISTFPVINQIPSLIIADGKTLTTQRSIWNKLRELKPDNTDESCEREVQSRIAAYNSYVYECLDTACNITLWVNENNFINLTEAWYMKAMVFPFNRIYAKNMKQETEKFLDRYQSYDEIAKQYYKKAAQCFNDLSVMLNKNVYLMGNVPTSLDAYVYGYLCVILKLPFPDKTLQNSLQSFPNLVKYIENITKTFFPDIKYEQKYLPKISDDESAPTMMIVAAAFFSFSVMTYYADRVGLLKLSK